MSRSSDGIPEVFAGHVEAFPGFKHQRDPARGLYGRIPTVSRLQDPGVELVTVSSDFLIKPPVDIDGPTWSTLMGQQD